MIERSRNVSVVERRRAYELEALVATITEIEMIEFTPVYLPSHSRSGFYFLSFSLIGVGE